MRGSFVRMHAKRVAFGWKEETINLSFVTTNFFLLGRPFNISFVGQISSNKDFVYRWTIVGIMLGYGIWLILEEGPVSFLETGGNLP